MREGWQVRKLAELVVVQNGYAFSSSEYAQTGHFVMRIGNVQNGYISTADPKYIRLPVDGSLNRFVLSEGDILVSLTGNVGRVGVIKDEHLPAALNQRVAKISIRNNSPATKEFLLLFLGSDWFREELTGAGHGAAQQNVSTKDLLEIEVAVPPLPEQQRIVALLDEAFACLATAKANAERNLQNARAVFESHLQTVFSQRGEGWVEEPLESCCEQIFAGGDVPKDRLSKVRTSQYSVPIYSNGEKDDGLYGFTDIARVTRPSVTVSARGTLGFAAIRTEPFLPVVRLIVLVPDTEKISLHFLYYAVVGMDFGNTGTSIPQLTVPSIKESKLHFPPLSEQIVIVQQLGALAEETHRLTRLCEHKLATLEELKKSLLHKAFNGEL